MRRVAIAHDYLTQRGGAERVVLALARAFPEAPIYTTLYDPDGTFPEFRDLDVRPSRLNRIGALRRDHRKALPLLPLASESVHIDADVVIASSSGWAHGFHTTGKKLVYCYAPARWLYQPDRYLGDDPNKVVATGLRLLSPALKRWDLRAARTADAYLANSTITRQRIKETYGIDAEVVFSPHPVAIGAAAPLDRGSVPDPGYFLVVSRLLPYKNVLPIVRAFAGRPADRLIVVGAGPQKAELQAAATPNVMFLENLTDEEMAAAYDGCVGLIAASHEDFGLTPLEAAAHGKPAAALRFGGFLDTVVEGATGVFFDEPTPEAIAAGVQRLAEHTWDPEVLRARAAEFSEPVFAARMRQLVAELAQR